MPGSYLRCSHCRGFYELARAHCRYCGKDVPVKDSAGVPKRFPDRATCRAIQVAEFEQLPEEAHEDPFQPDPELLDKMCYCLHCGEEGGTFEAVEMRWMATEGMWACPCTTCGGRGFTFDIHLAERLWQCVECLHWYPPANGDARASNAKCPKCGCTNASGWFDDEELTPEEEAELQREYEEFEAKRKEEERLGIREKTEPWKPEEWQREVDMPPEETMRDDIDFPHERKEDGQEGLLGNDDIPW